jgi:signal-transduction protein with cAMP-binding, CBS, and nucleotidyltransferase domain
MATSGGSHPVPEGARPVYTAPFGIGAHQVGRFMASRGTHAVIVMKGRRPLGIVTPRDLAERVPGGGLSVTLTTIESAMSSPLVMIGEWGTVGEAIDLMHRRGIGHLPIIGRDGKLASLITLDDALRLRGEGVQGFEDYVRASALVSMARRSWLKRLTYAALGLIEDNRTWILLAVGLALAGAALALILGLSWRGG